MNDEDLIKEWQNLSEDERFALGRPNFSCGRIARLMRQKGFECPKKVEDEQAMVILTMLKFIKEYGGDWKDKMNAWLLTSVKLPMPKVVTGDGIPPHLKE